MAKIVLDLEVYECLRGHLNSVSQIMSNCIVPAGEKNISGRGKKTSMKEREKRFEMLIGSGARARKPNKYKK